MSSSRRPRVIRARRENAPAFDTLRLLQLKVYLDAPQSVLESYGSESAKAGDRMFDTSRNADGPAMGAAQVLRAVSKETASLTQDVFKLVEPAKPRVAKSMFARTMFARKWERWHINVGAKLRGALVTVLEAVGLAAQAWTSTLSSGEWPSQISRAGRLRECNEAGCKNCGRRLVMIDRGVTQLACRSFDLDRRDFVWLLRAFPCAGDSRTPRSSRESVKTTACRLARGSPSCYASEGFWPGQKALGRPAVASNVAEPQAEPADSDVVLDAGCAPHASERESVQTVLSAQGSVVARIQCGAAVSTQPAPGFPLCAIGLSLVCAALVPTEVEPARRRNAEFEIGRRQFGTQYSVARYSLVGTFVPIERASGPVYPMLLRDRANRHRAVPLAAGDPEVARLALETALRATLSVCAIAACAIAAVCPEFSGAPLRRCAIAACAFAWRARPEFGGLRHCGLPGVLGFLGPRGS